MAIFDGIRKSVKLNLGIPDRIIRIAIGLIIIVLVFVNVIPFKGFIGLVPLVAVIYLLLTGDIGFCPIYRLFHLSTLKQPKQ
jgi:hypothetical protein